MASPCIDACRHDEETGSCLGCGMTRKERRHWKKEKVRRLEICVALHERIVALAAAGLPTGKAAKRKKEHD